VKNPLLCLAGLTLACRTMTPVPDEAQASAALDARPAPTQVSDVQAEKATPLAAVQVQPPFLLEVKQSTTKKLPLGLHSFAFGEADGKWLFVGGRTNGYHGTAGTSSTFPSATANKQFIVYDFASGKDWRLDAPARHLSTTNMQFVQDGGTLFVTGGYGSTCDEDKPSCYGTSDRLSAIQVKDAIDAVIAQDANKLKSSVVSIQDPRVQVSGGVMRKVGQFFYLVFGHNYSGIYKSAKNGQYTEAIRRFQLTFANGRLELTGYQEFKDASKQGTDSQYHRRDLNVAEAITPNGRVGLSAWGGVFTANDGAWRYPIHLEPQEDGTPNIRVDTSLEQKTNVYECAQVLMYDPATQVMYTSLLGGITDYSYDQTGTLVASTRENWMPFSKLITTLARSKDGVIQEHVQPPEQGLRDFIGANAEFVLARGLSRYGDSHTILDYSKLAGETVLVGYLVGGIETPGAQTSNQNPSSASAKIHEVFVVPYQGATRTTRRP